MSDAPRLCSTGCFGAIQVVPISTIAADQTIGVMFFIMFVVCPLLVVKEQHHRPVRPILHSRPWTFRCGQSTRRDLWHRASMLRRRWKWRQLGASITLLARDPAKLDAMLGKLDHRKDSDTTDRGGHGRHVGFGDRARSIPGRSPGGRNRTTPVAAPGPAHEADAGLERAFRLHLLAYQTLVRAVVPGMKAAGQRPHHQRDQHERGNKPLPNLG